MNNIGFLTRRCITIIIIRRIEGPRALIQDARQEKTAAAAHRNWVIFRVFRAPYSESCVIMAMRIAAGPFDDGFFNAIYEKKKYTIYSTFPDKYECSLSFYNNTTIHRPSKTESLVPV